MQMFCVMYLYEHKTRISVLQVPKFIFLNQYFSFKLLSQLYFLKCLDSALRPMIWFFGWYFGDPGARLGDPCGSLPTRDTLRFYVFLYVNILVEVNLIKATQKLK